MDVYMFKLKETLNGSSSQDVNVKNKQYKFVHMQTIIKLKAKLTFQQSCYTVEIYKPSPAQTNPTPDQEPEITYLSDSACIMIFFLYIRLFRE